MLSRRLRSLQRLADGLQRAPHGSRPSLQVFADLDPSVVARELDLLALATKKGAAEMPPTESDAFDEVEQAIVEKILSERKAARQMALDQLDTYAQRLASLDLQGQFANVQHAAPAAVTEFRTEALQGQDELHELRRRLSENEIERKDFRSRNKLVRAPRVASTFETTLKVSFLVFVFVSEAYFNTILLAKGNELGYVGAAAEATMFAVLNVLVSFFAAFWGARNLFHRSFSRKILGFICFVAWVIFAIVLNAALAHYREISGTLLENAAALVVARLRSTPTDLQLISWLFFGLGIAASVGSFADGIIFKDPYPGYGALEERVRAAHAEYRRRKEELIENLTDIRDDASKEMQAAQSELSKRRAEHEAILANRLRLIRLYDDHQELLEALGRKLLAEYRSANHNERKTTAPKHFNQVWNMSRSDLDAALPPTATSQNLDEELKHSRQILSTEIAAINTELENAVRTYHQIDALEREGWNGAEEKAA